MTSVRAPANAETCSIPATPNAGWDCENRGESLSWRNDLYRFRKFSLTQLRTMGSYNQISVSALVLEELSDLL